MVAEDSDIHAVNSEQESLVRLYIMVQDLEDNAAMDDTISALLVVLAKQHWIDDKGNRCKGTLPSDDAVTIAYEGTAHDSPLRHLMVDTYIWGATADCIDEDLPPVFIADVARAALRKLGPDYHKRVAQATCCDYHLHGEDIVCSSRKRKREKDDEDDERNSEDSEEGSGDGGTPKDKDSDTDEGTGETDDE